MRYTNYSEADCSDCVSDPFRISASNILSKPNHCSTASWTSACKFFAKDIAIPWPPTLTPCYRWPIEIDGLPWFTYSKWVDLSMKKTSESPFDFLNPSIHLSILPLTRSLRAAGILQSQTCSAPWGSVRSLNLAKAGLSHEKHHKSTRNQIPGASCFFSTKFIQILPIIQGFSSPFLAPFRLCALPECPWVKSRPPHQGRAPKTHGAKFGIFLKGKSRGNRVFVAARHRGSQQIVPSNLEIQLVCESIGWNRSHVTMLFFYCTLVGRIDFVQSCLKVCTQIYIYICVCVCICMYVCMYACMHACMHTYMYIYICTYKYVHTNTYIYMYIQICTYKYIYICIYMYIYIHIYYIYINICIYMCKNIYIYIYICIYIYVYMCVCIYVNVCTHINRNIYKYVYTYVYIYIMCKYIV